MTRRLVQSRGLSVLRWAQSYFHPRRSAAGVVLTCSTLALAGCMFDSGPIYGSEGAAAAQDSSLRDPALPSAAPPAAVSGRSAPLPPAAGGAAGSNACEPSALAVDSDQDGTPDCADRAPFGLRKRLTLDGAQVESTLMNFPVLIRIRDAELSAGARPDGSDIHFVAADGTSALDFELESYDPAQGAIVAWVRLPNLIAGVDAALFVGYGDGKGDRSNARGVWSRYQHVWHFGRDSSFAEPAGIKDSTQRSHGTAQGGMSGLNSVDAVAGNGSAFDGVDDHITFDNDFVGIGPSTLGAWVNQFAGNPEFGGAIIAFGEESMNRARFLFSLDTRIGTTDVGFYSNDLGGSALPTDSWHYLVWSWDGLNSSIYLNGVLTTGPTPHAGANTSGRVGAIGASVFSSAHFLRGQLDEVRIATSARSSGWIATEYENQRPDSTFIKSIDAEQPIGAP